MKSIHDLLTKLDNVKRSRNGQYTARCPVPTHGDGKGDRHNSLAVGEDSDKLLLYAITAWVAEFESSRRSERTKAGLVRAVTQGKKLGRPKGSRDKKKRRRSGYLLRYADAELRQKHSK